MTTKVKKAEEETAEAAEDAAAEERRYTDGEVNTMIQEAVRRALAEQGGAQAGSRDQERVHFLWMAEVSDDNVFEIGRDGAYGRIVGREGSFFVPKSELSRVMDAMFRLLLRRRWIVALDGLTDDEREAYGVNYHEGELLDKKAFSRMVELGERMLDAYPKLCGGHRAMVAKRYHEAFAANSPYVTREIVTRLNELSRAAGSQDGDFSDIIEAMNARDARG